MLKSSQKTNMNVRKAFNKAFYWLSDKELKFLNDDKIGCTYLFLYSDKIIAQFSVSIDDYVVYNSLTKDMLHSIVILESWIEFLKELDNYAKIK